jgi:hypothetical protein
MLCVAAGCSSGSDPGDGSGDGAAGAMASGGKADGSGDGSTGGEATASGGRTSGGTGTGSGGKGSANGGSATGGQAGEGNPESGGSAGNGGSGGGPLPSTPKAPAVERGGSYFGFSERFNRYYTDESYEPKQVVFVSPSGTGTGASEADPASVEEALAAAEPGTTVRFIPGSYSGCYELSTDQSGTYDDPVVLYGERNADGSLGVTIDCCDSGRHTCINLEAADYVAVDGFALRGGYYGVRSVSASYAADDHQVGAAVLHCEGYDQDRDPFFTGGADWFVIEGVFAHDVGTADGHGIYLSNGSDFNIARYNETRQTSSSDFQINADPLSTCVDEGVDVFAEECAGLAGSAPNAGAGASDYMWIEGNFFHHSGAQGANFTSVRHSRITNNIFAFATRHGVSFWQETDNPDLGSHDNFVAHNLFLTSSGQHAVQMINSSSNNEFRNNLVLAVSGNPLGGDSGGLLLETDGTTLDSTVFSDNFWISGSFGSADAAPSYEPAAPDRWLETWDDAWFPDLSPTANQPDAYHATAGAPWLDVAPRLGEVTTDRDGGARNDPTDAGPFEQ